MRIVVWLIAIVWFSVQTLTVTGENKSPEIVAVDTVIFIEAVDWGNASEPNYIYFRLLDQKKIEQMLYEASPGNDNVNKGDTISISWVWERYQEPGYEDPEGGDTHPLNQQTVIDMQVLGKGDVSKFVQNQTKEIIYYTDFSDPNLTSFEDIQNLQRSEKELNYFFTYTKNPHLRTLIKDTTTSMEVIIHIIPEKERKENNNFNLKAEIWNCDSYHQQRTFATTVLLKPGIPLSEFKVAE